VKANDVFRSIADVVAQVRAARPTLKFVTVVGGDDVVPMARLADGTRMSNEVDYVKSATNGGGALNGTPLTASMAAGRVLSDDPLGDVDPIPWLDHELYVPDLAVGRLVEAPADIVNQVNQFIAGGGVLDPSTALTTGYDFLADGAQAVNAALTAPVKQTLINETWTRPDELSALYPATGESPQVAALNAHYDHHRSLPGLGNSTGDESDLVTTDDIAAHPGALTRRIIFTMGCHAGLSVPDAYVPNGNGADWAQAFGGPAGAAVFLANTGFGYGDTAAVAYSEELMHQFALRLDGSMTVGEAAVYAKQAYFGSLGVYGPYDEKAMEEASLYGLPMYRVKGTGTVPPAPAPVATSADGNGIQSAPLALQPTFTRTTSPAGGTYFSVNGEVQLTQYRPIEPRTSVSVTPADSSLTAHGVLLTDLASHDETIVPAVSRPIVDSSVNEPPPPSGDVAFPSSIDTLTLFNTPTGPQQRAVFIPGQFFRDADWSASGGVQRLFDRVGAEVKYSASPDFTAPYLTNLSSSLDPSSATLSLRLDAADAASGVVRALVLVKDESGLWRRVELSPVAGSTKWVGTLSGVQGTRLEWFAQAVDGAGNVGTSSNKARYFGSRGFQPPVPISLSPPQPTGRNGWYTGPVVVSVPGQPGVSYTLGIDGPMTPYAGPQTISADGVHTVDAAGSDGSAGRSIVPLDQTGPAMTAVPDRAANGNGWYNGPLVVRFNCTDPTSGVQSCGPGATLGDEGAGQAVTGQAVDFACNQSTLQAGPYNLDFTPPAVSLTGVVDGASYDAGAAPAVSCAASDALSGLAGPCSVSVTAPANGYGQYRAVAVAVDRAGNRATASATWFVRYRFGGFLSPIVDTGTAITSSTSVFKSGSTIPVKFQLLDANGNPIQAGSLPLWITPVQGPGIGSAAVNQSSYKLTATSGSTFAYDAKNRMYTYNWNPPKSAAGSYWLICTRLDDGTTHTVFVGIK